MKTLALVVLLTAISSFELASAATPTALQLKGANLQPQAKISLKSAQTKALMKEPGVIVDQELEREAGGLRYSFDIKVGNVVHEVGIDASTGKVLEDSIDTGND